MRTPTQQRRFLEDLKNYDEAIGDFKRKLQGLKTAKSPADRGGLTRRQCHDRIRMIEQQMATLSRLADQLVMDKVLSLDDAKRLLGVKRHQTLGGQTLKWVTNSLLRGKAFELRDMRSNMSKMRNVVFCHLNGNVLAHVPAGRTRGPYSSMREAITAVGGFDAARIADGSATEEAYRAKASKIRERVERCGDDSIRAEVVDVKVWLDACDAMNTCGQEQQAEHKRTAEFVRSQRSRIMGHMVSLLLFDAQVERAERDARRQLLNRRAERGCYRAKAAPRPKARSAGHYRGGASIMAYPIRVVFPLHDYPSHRTNLRAALADVHGWKI